MLKQLYDQFDILREDWKHHPPPPQELDSTLN